MDSRNANHNHKQQFIKNSKSILTSQQTFISNKQNVFTEEVNKITWSANNNKRIQSVDSFKHLHTKQAKI